MGVWISDIIERKERKKEKYKKRSFFWAYK